MLSLSVRSGESVPDFGGQLTSKDAHDVLRDYVMQELGLLVNALSSARLAATLVLKCSSRKLETYRLTVDQLDLWQRLAEKTDVVDIPSSVLNPDAVLREVLRSDDLFSACVGTTLGSPTRI